MVNSDSEITDSSRYTPTCSLTPGWSRTICPEETPRMNWLAAARSVSIWALCGQLVFKAAGYNFYVTFFPAFLEYKYRIAKTDAGMLTTWPLIGVVVGALCGGAIIDGLFKRTGSKRLSRSGVAATALGLTATLVYASTFTGSAGQLVAADLLSGLDERFRHLSVVRSAEWRRGRVVLDVLRAASAGC